MKPHLSVNPVIINIAAINIFIDRSADVYKHVDNKTGETSLKDLNVCVC